MGTLGLMDKTIDEAGTTSLSRIVAALAGEGALEQRARHALTLLREATGFPAAVLRAFDPATRRLHAAAHSGVTLPAEWLTPACPGDHPCGIAAERGEVVHIPDLKSEAHPPSGWASAGYRAYVSVPLYATGRLRGTLTVAAPQVVEPSPDELRLLADLAAPFALALAAAAPEAGARGEFETLYELAPDAIVTVDRDGTILLMNSEAERMFGYRREELVGNSVEILLPERFRERHVARRAEYHDEPRTRPMGIGMELLALRRSGEEFPVEISLAITGDDSAGSVIAIIRDSTERVAAEQGRRRLLASERQKGEQLKLAVREAHHRIKNNLQAISDLMYLELASVKDSQAGSVLRESLERIQSIALVHDLLSQDEDVQTVDAQAMLKRLVPMVLQNASPTARSADLQMSLAAVPLSSKKATTLALLCSELVSNAGKHGLAGPDPRLEILLEPLNDGLRLMVRDNGPGLPAGFDFARDASVGLQVVRTLAERDLQGKFSFSSGPGLSAEVWFPW